jgi:hypothetical protein
MANKPQFVYAVGDRVAERPKTHGIFTSNPEVRQRIAQHRTQRYGTVLELKNKRNSRGNTIKTLVVQWDHLTSPSEHPQMRICPIDHLNQLTKKTTVPGE